MLLLLYTPTHSEKYQLCYQLYYCPIFFFFHVILLSILYIHQKILKYIGCIIKCNISPYFFPMLCY